MKMKKLKRSIKILRNIITDDINTKIGKKTKKSKKQNRKLFDMEQEIQGKILIEDL